MKKVIKLLLPIIGISLGIFISRYARYQKESSRPVEMESIPAGYIYEGRFGDAKDFYSKVESRDDGVVEISGYRVDRKGGARSGLSYAIDCKKELRRWDGQWAPIQEETLAEAFYDRYCR